MKLRLATNEDLLAIHELYENALGIMKRNNSTQWTRTKTPISIFTDDIGKNLYVLEDEWGKEIVAMGIIETISDDFFDNFIDFDKDWCTIRKVTAQKRNGSFMMAKMTSEALKQHKVVYVDTLEANLIMMSHIKNLGYETIGKAKRDEKQEFYNHCFKMERK